MNKAIAVPLHPFNQRFGKNVFKVIILGKLEVVVRALPESTTLD